MQTAIEVCSSSRAKDRTFCTSRHQIQYMLTFPETCQTVAAVFSYLARLRRTLVATVVISLSTSVTTISVTKVLVDCVRGIAICDIHAKFWRQLCDCVKFSQGPYDMAWANILKHGQSSCGLSLLHSPGTCILYDSRHIPWQQHSLKSQFYGLYPLHTARIFMAAAVCFLCCSCSEFKLLQRSFSFFYKQSHNHSLMTTAAEFFSKKCLSFFFFFPKILHFNLCWKIHFNLY